MTCQNLPLCLGETLYVGQAKVPRCKRLLLRGGLGRVTTSVQVLPAAQAPAPHPRGSPTPMKPSPCQASR